MAMAAPTNSGCILPHGKWKAFGRRTMFSYSCSVGHKLFGSANAVLRGFPVYSLRNVSLSCKAGPSNHRRNPDFPRQHKGSSRGKNRQYHDRENSDSLEESDPLPSKNGSLLSLSGNQKYSGAATPGKREKEIIELFRKVQAQLRQRAAMKEEKKMEASQQGQGERGTVDSLLKLLRKHSASQGKKSVAEEEINVDRAEGGDPFEDEPSSTFFSSSSIPTSDDVPEPAPLTSSRPPSKFRRRSPVPRVKFQPVFSAEKIDSALSSEGKQKISANKGEEEVKALEEPGEVSSEELSDSSDTEIEKSTVESTDFASLKLVELRGLAKSQGFKGYSKLKKGELIELLSGDGS